MGNATMKKKAFRKILKTIREKKSFLISTHVNPDPDALASELSLFLFLRRLGKRVVAINESSVPKRYLFLPGAKAIGTPSQALKKAFEVALVVDEREQADVARR